LGKRVFNFFVIIDANPFKSNMHTGAGSQASVGFAGEAGGRQTGYRSVVASLSSLLASLSSLLSINAIPGRLHEAEMRQIELER